MKIDKAAAYDAVEKRWADPAFITAATILARELFIIADRKLESVGDRLGVRIQENEIRKDLLIDFHKHIDIGNLDAAYYLPSFVWRMHCKNIMYWVAEQISKGKWLVQE